MDRKRPVIGISAYDVPVDVRRSGATSQTVLVPAAYTRSVTAGGRAAGRDPADRWLDRAARPARRRGLHRRLRPRTRRLYGQEPHPETRRLPRHRDRAELALMREALRRDMPMLGICRGMQLLNVAARRRPAPAPRRDGPTRRRTGRARPSPPRRRRSTPGTRLADCSAPAPRTHSCHHQAPDRIGRGPARRRRRPTTARSRRVEQPGHALRGGRAVAPRGGRGARRAAVPRAGGARRPRTEGGGMSTTTVEGLVIGGDAGRRGRGARPSTSRTRQRGPGLPALPAAGVEDVDRAVAAATRRLRELGGALARHPRPAHAPVRQRWSRSTPRSWRCSSAATWACRSATPAASSA